MKTYEYGNPTASVVFIQPVDEFALWTSYCTDMFTAVAAASPSMWFPGFTDFMENNEILCDSVYLSLGDREEKEGKSIRDIDYCPRCKQPDDMFVLVEEEKEDSCDGENGK